MNHSAEFEALRREYIRSALQRSRILKEAASALRRGEAVDLNALRQEIHKFRGSGGFYGFPRLSEAAGNAEDQLIRVLDGETERDDQALAELVEQVITEAEEAARSIGE